MIDTSKKIRFYDDRGKDKELYTLSHILYENGNICLGKTNTGSIILFTKKTGKVLVSHFEFWYAENYE
jgi:hypothetical protein